jgi:hypothetical protein
MPTEFRFDDLDLREEPARADAERGPLFGSSGLTEACTATTRCTRVCCTCPPPLN